MWYIARLDSSRVPTLVKVRSVTRVSSSDPTRVKSNYIPYILRFYGKSNAAPGSDDYNARQSILEHIAEFNPMDSEMVQHWLIWRQPTGGPHTALAHDISKYLRR